MNKKPLLTQKGLVKHLGDIDIDVFCFDFVDSTNNVAGEITQLYNAPKILVTALHQTTGRGTRGRSFSSPENCGIYMSIAFEPNERQKSALGLVTPAAAVGVAEAIERECGVLCGIKWVNDIYVDGKKLCGILSELKDVKGRKICIVGVGVNIVPFIPEDGAVDPAFLQDFCKNVDAEELCAEICRSIVNYLIELDKRTFLAAYRAHSIVLGRELSFEQNGEKYTGVAQSIDNDGHLLVKTEQGLMLLSSGDVSINVKK